MRQLLNHPWVLALVGSLFGAVMTEVTPLKLITKYVGPMALSVSAALAGAVSVPLWILPALAVVFALVPLGARAVWRHAMRSRHTIVEGIMFNAGYHTVVEVWPICRRCRGVLMPTIQPEERRDRNNVPFIYRPDEPNVLLCETCGDVTQLKKSLGQLAETARMRTEQRLVPSHRTESVEYLNSARPQIGASIDKP